MTSQGPPPTATRFFFVRHGESAHNAAGLFCGALDSPLTATGQDQAVQAAEKLAGEQLDWIVSSPLSRALDTANTIARHHAVAVIVDRRLVEHGKGVMEGTPYHRLRSREWAGVEGAETMEMLYARVQASLADLGQLSGFGVVVAHAGVARAVECVRLGTYPEDLYELPKVANADPYLVELR